MLNSLLLGMFKRAEIPTPFAHAIREPDDDERPEINEPDSFDDDYDDDPFDEEDDEDEASDFEDRQFAAQYAPASSYYD